MVAEPGWFRPAISKGVGASLGLKLDPGGNLNMNITVLGATGGTGRAVTKKDLQEAAVKASATDWTLVQPVAAILASLDRHATERVCPAQ